MRLIGLARGLRQLLGRRASSPWTALRLSVGLASALGALACLVGLSIHMLLRAPFPTLPGEPDLLEGTAQGNAIAGPLGEPILFGRMTVYAEPRKGRPTLIYSALVGDAHVGIQTPLGLRQVVLSEPKDWVDPTVRHLGPVPSLEGMPLAQDIPGWRFRAEERFSLDLNAISPGQPLWVQVDEQGATRGLWFHSRRDIEHAWAQARQGAMRTALLGGALLTLVSILLLGGIGPTGPGQRSSAGS